MALPILPTALPSLGDRDAIIDSLYRGVISLDTGDEATFLSAFTDDAVVDINGTLLKGLPTIRGGMFETISKINTTHFITNVRVDHEPGESTAKVTAHALAQHFRSGQGFGPDEANLLTGSLYYSEVVKGDSDGLWKAKLFQMRTSWAQGDRAIAQGK
ncbi:hypothetical protein UA08_05015 [Talaromyces atroroseus]|uniref:SnoaL-like domain-containing protein n=1 Tax=Talaromyces atroroseus TaxID=1441469 RepID=A0A225AMK5_TALAT|nr:hypothetical protein UA08_05015 [Talaromyces atroroseus]OKL59564.1 hypothetical protein UA08_05015 [Talaromyces atroroseus]